jgi:protein subunit release factor B
VFVEHDSCPVYLEIQEGVGETKSMDWVDMVLLMCKMWAQHRQLEVTIVDKMLGELVGIKCAMIRMDGIFRWDM